jgi:acyl-CoA dehydrogenase
MKIDFGPEYDAFRDEVRAFLDDALDDDLRAGARLNAGMFQDYKTNIRWHKILHKKGWIAPAWPREYGGCGWDLAQKYIWGVTCGEAGTPGLMPTGLGMCGPMLIGHGTQEQKDYYLPRILSGDDYWCQGYSEPGSGSDLASLQMKAESNGDDYILNGTKIWTSHAHHANRMFGLVRTDNSGKPQQGITFILLDMDTPGITIEPIIFSSGEYEVNQVFFDNVRVPKANRVGKENDGWTVAKYLLEFERGGGNAAGRMKIGLQKVKKLARNTKTNGASLMEDPAFTAKCVDAETRIEALQYTEFRIMAALVKGGSPGPESSILKNLSSDLGQRLTELTVEAVGDYVFPDQKPAREVGANIAPIGPTDAVTALPRYLNVRASGIAGGTNEVQMNIVAKAVLGL